jgi:hypothetical protein
MSERDFLVQLAEDADSQLAGPGQRNATEPRTQ